ncbi:MAG: hypothetical protein H6Q52_3269 [Deltaproteobacteria bacterium]|nr:hypothetical protein [Deltaproteobacteria bacterium]
MSFALGCRINENNLGGIWVRITNMIRVIFFLLFVAATPWVYGQTAPPAQNPPENEWRFSVIPFMWATTIDSKVTVGGYDVDTTTSFSDIWHNLNGALMLHMEAQKGKFGLFFEPMYSKIKADGTFIRQRVANLPAIPRDLTLTYEQWIIEGGAFYQAGKWRVGENKDQWMTLDVFAGARYWSIKADLDTSTLINPDRSDSWVDPIIGARFTADLSKNVMINFRGDIGGFGVGSDFTWNGLAVIGYRFNEYITGLMGYRALYVDYKSGTSRVRFEETLHGPIMGVAFTF